MNRIKKRIAIEWNHFQQLPANTQRFFAAAIGYNFFDSIVFTFAYAYMFSQTDSFIAVAIFNIAFFITLLLGFFANIPLLKRYNPKHLFIVSSLLQGLSLFSVFYYSQTTLESIAFAGFLCGFFQGVYWSVRNSAYIYFTNDDNRHYFEGIKSMLQNGHDLVMLSVAGWFIATSELFSVIDKITAYRIVGLTGLLVLVVGTFFLRGVTFPTITITHLKLHAPSKQWNLFRVLVIVSAVQFALAMSVPETITLHFLGHEGVLGTLQSIFVVISAFAMYVIGRKSNKGHRFRLLLSSAIPLLTFSLLLMMTQTPLVVIGFLLSLSVSNQLFWFTYFPIFSRAVEYEEANESKQYAYILDHEIWINVSRVAAIIMYVVLVEKLDGLQGMFVALAIGAITQVATALIARPLLALQNNQYYNKA
jgi:YQGE family putative transporter